MKAFSMRKTTGLALAAVPAILALLGQGCRSGDAGADEDPAGNILRGTVVDGSGRPVRGARVSVLPDTRELPPLAKSVIAGPPVRSAVTDGEGHYLFTEMAPGAYSLQGQDDAGGRVFLRLGVEYAGSGLAADLGSDTLREPGILQGRATTWYQDRSGIICAIPGTSYLALTDSAGDFTMGGVPQGEYALSCRLEGFSPAHSTKTAVLSGGVSRIDSIYLSPLPETPPPPPQGLRAEYDTARGVVTLHWHPSRFRGFHRYRLTAHPAQGFNDFGMAPFTMVGADVDDTVFTDSLWRYTDMDTALYAAAHPGAAPEPFAISVTYSIAAEDSANPYRQRELPATILIDSDKKRWSQNRIYDLYEIGRPSHPDPYNRPQWDPIALGDTVRLVFRWRDSFLSVRKFLWGPNRNNYEPVLKVAYPNAREFQDTLVQVIDASVLRGETAMIDAVVQLGRSPGPDSTFRMALMWVAPLATTAKAASEKAAIGVAK